MKSKIHILFHLTMLLPVVCLAAGENAKHIHFYAEVLSFVNLALLVTSIICVKQFFIPGDENRTPFQLFNLLFILLFYAVSLSFLVRNKEYYIGFEQLSPQACIKKIFFDKEDIWAIVKQWFIVFTFFINILYISKNWKDQFFTGDK